MSRPREFNEEAVADRAAELFRCRGFAGSGVAELCDELGIGRGSLYATFGSKQGLWEAALQRYRDREAAPLLAALESGPVLPVLRRALEGAAQVDPTGGGCLVVGAAAERVPSDSATAAQVADQLGRLTDAMAVALRRAQATGELAADADPLALARFLVATVNGLRLAAKATPDPAALRDVVEVALSAVPTP